MSLLSADMLGLIAPAFAVGIIVSAIHVPLGHEVLRRGIIFIDLAIAQIAALGVVFGKVIFHVEEELWSFILALVFALGGSGLFAWLEKKDSTVSGSLYRLRLCNRRIFNPDYAG